ncbi:MAG: hypothetical protein A3K19_23300 [Lentisphaerae bacterium RIFOXYB12_FULL_65_16]|nr:MAG: hypothetical protein A3K19_23300 [Lentisphaerae bacterium RIFOXYB12_FULL_65_16]
MPAHVSHADLDSLLARRLHVMAELQSLGDFRQGSLVERFRRCGKPRCHCANPGDPGHGPSFSLTRSAEGKTITQVIPAQEARTAGLQIAEYHRFRGLCRELTAVNEEICRVRLAAASEAAAEKKTSSNPSKRKSGSKPRG